MAWSGIDFFIVGIVGLSALTGLMRGFFKELIALGAWILAIWLAIVYSSLLATALKPYITDSTLRSGLAFVMIVVGILILGALVNVILGFLLRHSGLTVADRILGMGFGFIRGVIIVSLVIVVVGMSGVNMAPYQARSKLYAYFNPVVSWMAKYVQPFITKAATSQGLEKLGGSVIPPVKPLKP